MIIAGGRSVSQAGSYPVQTPFNSAARNHSQVAS